MQTDSWFYRFLKAWPGGFFGLLGLPATLAERYTFDSVELKKTGWRIDGVQLIQEILVKRFVHFSKEEIRRMIQLHDIRESRAVQEACEETGSKRSRKLQ